MIAGVCLCAAAACGETDTRVGSPDVLNPAEAMAECQRHCNAEVGRCEAPEEGELEFCIEECLELATWIRSDVGAGALPAPEAR